MTVGYGVILLLSIALLIAYLFLVKDKDLWLTLIYAYVAVINLGYLLGSIAPNVPMALIANDVVSLGSIFVCSCMFFASVRLCGFEVKRRSILLSLLGGLLLFSIIATARLVPWYYTSVKLQFLDGASILVKEYGLLSISSLVYLLGYVVAMVVTIIHSIKLKKPGSQKLAGMLALIVGINAVVWVCEKFARWEFEFLSISYLASELMLLFVYWMMQDYVHKREISVDPPEEKARLGSDVETASMEAKLERVSSLLSHGEKLTSREREILELILANKKRREIAEHLHLSENTVKTYTRTLYAKLGVSCREELYTLLLDPPST